MQSMRSRSKALEDFLEAVMVMVEDTELILEDVDTKNLPAYLAVMGSKEG